MIRFWSYIFLSITCCFRGSSKHFMHIGLSAPKIISLYLIMCPWYFFQALVLFLYIFDVSLTLFSSSCLVFIHFRRGIFDSFAFFYFHTFLNYTIYMTLLTLPLYLCFFSVGRILIHIQWFNIFQLTFTCSKSTIETLEKDVKCIQS